MDIFCILFFVSVLIIAGLGFKIWFNNADADLSLLFKEKFGKKIESLRGKVIWITGASSGLGEYLAYEFAKVGCKLVLSARSEQQLHDCKKKCLTYGKISEDDVLVLPLDVTNTSTHQEATKQVLDKFGQIDVLVNNAGRSQRAWVVDTDLQVDRDMIELNVIGQISLTKCVLPHMVERKSGHIVVNSSVAGKIGLHFSATYCLTKFAVKGWYESLMYEVYDKNIAVTVICPGPAVSNFLKVAFTGTPGQIHGGSADNDPNRLTTERCAELMAVGIANRMGEIWISKQPFLTFLYMSQYMPAISERVRKMIGLKRLMNIREGR